MPLAHFDNEVEIFGASLASERGLGVGLLRKKKNRSTKRVIHISRLETLSTSFIVNQIHMFLLGRSILLRTDDPALVERMGNLLIIQSWGIILLNCNFQMQYIQSKIIGYVKPLEDN